MYKNELEHVGVLGMKWGHRKSIGGMNRLFKKRTEPEYDKNGNDISKNPFSRIGKAKFQSDKDFDKEYNAEMKALGKEVKAEKAAKAKKMVETIAKNREATDKLMKESYAFRQMKFIDMKLGGNPDSSPAAVWTRNIVGQMVVAGVTIGLMSKLDIP